MLMFLGISGRFMFFTADTARAGAPAIPAYTHTQTHTKHTHGRLIRFKSVQKKLNKKKTCCTGQNTEYQTQTHTVLNRVLDKKTADKMQKHLQLLGQTKCANVHPDAFIASYAHALFGSIMIYTTTRANYESTMTTYCMRPITNSDVLNSTGHSSNGQEAALFGEGTHQTFEH